MNKPKILFFDIETAGVNAFNSDLGFVIAFGYKWQGEKRVHCLTIDQFGEWHGTSKGFSDKKLLQEASKIFNEADLVVAHYGSVFDRRFLQGRLLINKLPPLPHTKMRDTCFMARKIGAFSSNRLGHLSKILDLDMKKQDKGWPNWWFQVMAGDTKALKKMAKYCKGDVLALEELYNRLAPFDHNHPRMVEDRVKCGNCGGDVQFRGSTFYNGRRYRRTSCKECGHWGRAGLLPKGAK